MNIFAVIIEYLTMFAGALNVSVCPLNTVIDKIGASSIHDCGSCPAGKVCPTGSILAKPCNPGHYCEYAQQIKPCPTQTYNGLEGAMNLTWCLPCPAGYWCNREGMSTYLESPCPPGSYCSEAVDSPIECPPGTYRYAT